MCNLEQIRKIRNLADGTRSVSKIVKITGYLVTDVKEVINTFDLPVSYSNPNEQRDNSEFTEEEFVKAVKKGWDLIRKHKPQRFQMTLGRLTQGSPAYVSGAKKPFLELVCSEFWEFESNPQVFDFIERDWKSARDLIVFAAAI